MTPEQVAEEVAAVFYYSETGIKVDPGQSLALPLQNARFLRGRQFRHSGRIEWDEIQVVGLMNEKPAFRLFENIIWNTGAGPIWVSPKRDR